MTCRTSSLNWLDVLYNSVRKTPGGVADAAAYLADRRGKSMHPETLRAKLRGLEGESLTIEHAELLTEWMQEKAGGCEYALEWMQALAEQGSFAERARALPGKGPGHEAGPADSGGAGERGGLARHGAAAGAAAPVDRLLPGAGQEAA